MSKRVTVPRQYRQCLVLRYAKFLWTCKPHANVLEPRGRERAQTGVKWSTARAAIRNQSEHTHTHTHSTHTGATVSPRSHTSFPRNNTSDRHHHHRQQLHHQSLLPGRPDKTAGCGFSGFSPRVCPQAPVGAHRGGGLLVQDLTEEAPQQPGLHGERGTGNWRAERQAGTHTHTLNSHGEEGEREKGPSQGETVVHQDAAKGGKAVTLVIHGERGLGRGIGEGRWGGGGGGGHHAAPRDSQVLQA